MYRTLVVDDEEITRNAIGNFITNTLPDLSLEGKFSNGSCALAFLEKHPVDLVITDIQMPIMDGLTLSKHISELYPHCIIIIISAYSEFEYAHKALQYGVKSYVLKPIDFEDLTENIMQAKKQLHYTHILNNQSKFADEDREVFFIDLMTGNLKDPAHLTQRYQEINLPFTLKDSSGFHIKLSINSNKDIKQWKYGRGHLGTAFLNTLRMSLENSHIYLVFQSDTHYFFLCISQEVSFDEIIKTFEEHIFSILEIPCTIAIQTAFDSLLELASAHSLPHNILTLHKNQVKSDNDIVIQKAIEYIHTHYSTDLTRADVADAVYLSSAYFSRFFKQKTGQTFFDYLTTVRMQKAIELLGNNFKVAEIAKMVGYQSRNRFFINFRQYTSYNPTEYRRQILKIGGYDE